VSNLTVGFAGLTHLGTCSSVGASIHGNNVVAFDTDNQVIAKRLMGRFDSAEPGIEDFLQSLPSNYQLTNNVSDLKKCDLVMISIDSPIDGEGNVNSEPVEKYFDLVAQTIDSNVPIVILSQVRPGFTRKIHKFRLETYYQMETLIFGQGLERALKPERYVIGLVDETKPLNKKYEEYLRQGNCPLLPMSFESAELTKLSVNFFLASTITATNTLAALSSKLGANWRQIAESLKLDRRIGPYAYLNAGLGIGGSNIIRDLIGIREMTRSQGTDASIVDAMLKNSEFSKNWLMRQLSEIISLVDSPRIGILGLSYKQNTDSTIGSSGVKTARSISRIFPTFVYDPVVMEDKSLIPYANWVKSAQEVVSSVDIIIISTEWKEFTTNEFGNVIMNSQVKFIVDPFGCQLHLKSESSKINYRTIGEEISVKKS
jgi:UDPglucose 6-dehydrogenase